MASVVPDTKSLFLQTYTSFKTAERHSGTRLATKKRLEPAILPGMSETDRN